MIAWPAARPGPVSLLNRVSQPRCLVPPRLAFLVRPGSLVGSCFCDRHCGGRVFPARRLGGIPPARTSAPRIQVTDRDLLAVLLSIKPVKHCTDAPLLAVRVGEGFSQASGSPGPAVMTDIPASGSALTSTVQSGRPIRSSRVSSSDTRLPGQVHRQSSRSRPRRPP